MVLAKFVEAKLFLSVMALFWCSFFKEVMILLCLLQIGLGHFILFCLSGVMGIF